ncbi:hypothetical protein [Streptomyces sp. NPDC002640]
MAKPPIAVARALHQAAARATALTGPAHPRARSLLAAAARAAACVWEAGHPVTALHPRTARTAPVPDDLYQRYMAATRAHRDHAKDCGDCRPDVPCTTGQRLYESLARLQDAYLNRQTKQR